MLRQRLTGSSQTNRGGCCVTPPTQEELTIARETHTAVINARQPEAR